MFQIKTLLVDSPLEGRVRSEPVSEIGLFRAILDGNKLVFGAGNREESQPWLAIPSVPLKTTPVVRSHDLFAIEGPLGTKRL
jgi:hypothetical protein